MILGNQALPPRITSNASLYVGSIPVHCPMRETAPFYTLPRNQILPNETLCKTLNLLEKLVTTFIAVFVALKQIDMNLLKED